MRGTQDALETTGSAGHRSIERSLIQPEPRRLAIAGAGRRCRRKPAARGWQRPLARLRRTGQFFFALSFSSLTRRIVLLNLAGLLVLVVGILISSSGAPA